MRKEKTEQGEEGITKNEIKRIQVITGLNERGGRNRLGKKGKKEEEEGRKEEKEGRTEEKEGRTEKGGRR